MLPTPLRYRVSSTITYYITMLWPIVPLYYSKREHARSTTHIDYVALQKILGKKLEKTRLTQTSAGTIMTYRQLPQ